MLKYYYLEKVYENDFDYEFETLGLQIDGCKFLFNSRIGNSYEEILDYIEGGRITDEDNNTILTFCFLNMVEENQEKMSLVDYYFDIPEQKIVVNNNYEFAVI